MTHSGFQLRRLRIMRLGSAVYDNHFHSGVNIIRGENGSGKSTVADFIFYILGGEFESWKTAAADCDEVQAEVVTASGTLTVRREVAGAQSPIHVYYGTMDDAGRHGIDSWNIYPIRRAVGRDSFSQILFRAAVIPESVSQGSANITMHQVLRLTYSDQRTPSAFLFRYEPFDRREIREAVGDLLCGLSVYELYEIELKLRERMKDFEEKKRAYDSIVLALPPNFRIAPLEYVDNMLEKLTQEYDRIVSEITNAEELIDGRAVSDFMNAQKVAGDQIRRLKRGISKMEQERHTNGLEIADIVGFIEYLQELAEKLPRIQRSSEIVGRIDFTHCPACLAPLRGDQGFDHCVVCGSVTSAESERSRHLQIKSDMDLQIRESRQLLEGKKVLEKQIGFRLRGLRRKCRENLSEYMVRYEVSGSPRDSFLAVRYQRIGQIDRERSELDRMKEKMLELRVVESEKENIEHDIGRLRNRKETLEEANRGRHTQALRAVSGVARELLAEDIARQDEFVNPQNVEINFADNSILVDGELNFAESSNVIVKNSGILALLLAAAEDEGFHHPRFALFDNVEDKGNGTYP